MRNLYSYVTAAFLLLCSSTLFSQGFVRGIVKDAQTSEPLAGATVLVANTSNGTITNTNGNFELKSDPGDVTLEFKFIGFETKTVNVTISGGATVNTGIIYLQPTTFGLTGIQVIAERAQERKTPVAISNMEKQKLDQLLGSQDIPLVMNVTPNVYATMQGGGAGDARVNVRGFNQNNVAIMINGVPINDMENGWVYWSNWDGVGDATSSIQIQRGMSAVNLATPSIGGTMNVITNPAEQTPGFTYKQEFGTGNFLKSTIFGHTGLIKNKYAFSAGVVRKTGQGIIDKTWTDAWAYYFGAAWNVNAKNRLEFYAIGAPQKHGQNSYRQNIAAYSHKYAASLDDYDTAAFSAFDADQSGRYYNETWGKVSHRYTGKQYWNGKEHDRYNPHFISERENYFHKPLVNLNWYSQFSEKVSLYTVAYYSGGTGGGSGTKGSMKWDYSGPSRMIDYDATIANNMLTDTARGILRNSVNNQWSLGLISKLKWTVNEKFNVSFGIDGRTAEIEHFREVRDLLGGMFFIDKANKFESTDLQYQKVLGDKVEYFFTNTVNWGGAYAQGEYDFGAVTAYGMFGYSGIQYAYTNHFVKSEENEADELTAKSKWIGGFQVKGGANYNVSESVNIFANIGYISKVPIFDNVINDRDGSTADNPENEKFFNVELGSQYFTHNRDFILSGNVYFTNWKDRTQSISIVNEDGSEGFVFITGMNQRHYGLELEGSWRPINWFELLFAGSVNNWTYTDDVTGVYKDYSSEEEEVPYNYYVKGLKVGDAPQIQGILGLTFYPVRQWRIELLTRHYRNHYADWDPFSREDPEDTEQVWKTPAYTVFDLHTSYDIPVDGRLKMQLFMHIFNLTDAVYVQDATDNSSFNAYRVDGDIVNPHKADAAEVYLGLPRNFNFGVRINF